MVITYGDKIKAKLDKKIFQSAVFDPKVVSIYTQGTTVNAEDEITASIALQGTTVAVPYDLMQSKYSPQAWGKVIEGDGQIAFRYDTTIDVESVVRIEGVDYKVVDIDPSYLPDSVVKICTLSRILD